MKEFSTFEKMDNRQRQSPKPDVRRNSSPAPDDRRNSSPASDDRRNSSPASDDRRISSLATDDRRKSFLASDDRRNSSPAPDDRRKFSPAPDNRRNLPPVPDDRQMQPLKSGAGQPRSNRQEFRQNHIQQYRYTSPEYYQNQGRSSTPDYRQYRISTQDIPRQFSVPDDRYNEFSSPNDRYEEFQTKTYHQPQIRNFSPPVEEVPRGVHGRLSPQIPKAESRLRGPPEEEVPRRVYGRLSPQIPKAESRLRAADIINAPIIPEITPIQQKEAFPKILVMGGKNRQKFFKISIGALVLTFDPLVNKWYRAGTLPCPRHQHCAAYLLGCVYVVGGCDLRQTIESNVYIPKSSCFKLNLENYIWHQVANMNYERFDHGLATLGGIMYAIGGEEHNGVLLKTMEIYQPSMDKWTVLKSDLCCGRKAMGVAAHQGKLWIVGGIFRPEREANMHFCSFVECYDPCQQRWKFDVSRLPRPRCFCSLVTWRDRLYCIGGIVRDLVSASTVSSSDVLFFDEEINSWEFGVFLPEPRSGPAAVICGDHLFVLGGFDKRRKVQLNSVISITSNASSWTTMVPLPTPLSGLAAVNILQ